MSDAKISFAQPAAAEMRTGDGWHAVRVRSVEHAKEAGTLVVVLTEPHEGIKGWTILPNAMRSQDRRLSRQLQAGLKRAIGAKVTGILRGIADMTDAIVRGEGAE